ncbi:MAG: VWA domain-containing protein, partial [Elusimicrobia bacterium]|nr:VWA domain-containing protein [Elusimicrobiota bacterium]
SKVYEKVNLEDRIASLKDGGGTLIGIGLIKAISLLDVVTGSKNIILISDGKTQAGGVAEEAAKAASNAGIRIYTVGVGPITNEEFMTRIADITNGIYFRATERSRLKLLFGKPEDQPPAGGQLGLAILNSNHFITENLELNARVYGYNAVAPKTTGRQFPASSFNDSIFGPTTLTRLAGFSSGKPSSATAMRRGVIQTRRRAGAISCDFSQRSTASLSQARAKGKKRAGMSSV